MCANAKNHAPISLAPPSVKGGGAASRLGFLASALLHVGVISALCLAWGSDAAFQPFQGGGRGGPLWVCFSADAKAGHAGGGSGDPVLAGDASSAVLQAGSPAKRLQPDTSAKGTHPGGPESAARLPLPQTGQKANAHVMPLKSSALVPSPSAVAPSPRQVPTAVPSDAVSSPKERMSDAAPETPSFSPSSPSAKKHEARPDSAPRKSKSTQTEAEPSELPVRGGASASFIPSGEFAEGKSVARPAGRVFSPALGPGPGPQEKTNNAGPSRRLASGATGAGPSGVGSATGAAGSPEGGGNALSGDFGDGEIAFGGADGPAFLYFAAPEYPASARRRGIEGLVTLRVRISERGMPENVEVVSSVDESLGRAASRAVERATFVPYSPAGKPRSCWSLVPVRFRLK